MNAFIPKGKGTPFCQPSAFLAFFLIFAAFFTQGYAQIIQQTRRAAGGETAVCTIKLKSAAKANRTVNKALEDLQLISSNGVSFDMVPNLNPKDKIPIEVFYTQGKPGEKVLLSVEDGGSLDNNKKILVLALNNQNKVSFNFQLASDLGIYRITLRKGEDVKEVQLWAGPELSTVKK